MDFQKFEIDGFYGRILYNHAIYEYKYHESFLLRGHSQTTLTGKKGDFLNVVNVTTYHRLKW